MQFKTKYEGPYIEIAQLIALPVADWRFQRPVTRVGKCCQCGWCYIFCPTGCIEDKGDHFAANLDFCKGCGTCAKECPVDAVVMIRESHHD